MCAGHVLGMLGIYAMHRTCMLERHVCNDIRLVMGLVYQT